MSDKKTKSIPSWQRADKPAVSTSSKEIVQDWSEPDRREDTSRASVVEEASKSLQDHDVRDAPIERKRYLLRSKGLSDDEIDKLLKVSRTENDSSDAGEVQAKDSPSNLEIKTSVEGKGKVVEDKSLEPTPSSSHDIPPIITYPEFLLRTQKPPPLVTVSHLLTSLYVISGAAATAYGTSNYIINPMIESLNTARHSLFETAGTNLQTLVEKLEQVVSSIPDGTGTPKSLLREEDDSSTSSDAAEFFHRSAATQTTPGLSRSPSSITAQTHIPVSPLTGQYLCLQRLHDNLSDLMVSTDRLSSQNTNHVKYHMDELHDYLFGMAYVIPNRKADLTVEKDQIAKVKAEIRSVKGALLSARNFP